MTDWKYFTREEFACSETGENEIQDDFITKLDRLRELCGFAFVINSGYRSPDHSIEAAKDKPGQHCSGRCCDIAVSGGWQRYRIVNTAMGMGFNGIGVDEGFVHIDERETTPVLWTY